MAARTVVVAGASGLVGREILQGLLADDSVAAVHSLGRRELPLTHPRLTQYRVDFKALPALPSDLQLLKYSKPREIHSLLVLGTWRYVQALRPAHRNAHRPCLPCRLATNTLRP